MVQVNEANEGKVESVDEIAGIETYDYAAGQEHVQHAGRLHRVPAGRRPARPRSWADCTGTVYDVDIRHENAVHSLEHGAVWITYNPDEVSDADVATLAELVDGESGRMLSPYVGLDSPISLQSWDHQLKVDSADDERIEQFADFLTRNSDFHPEVGASCENPDFLAAPLVAGDASTPIGPSDLPTTTTPDHRRAPRRDRPGRGPAEPAAHRPAGGDRRRPGAARRRAGRRPRHRRGRGRRCRRRTRSTPASPGTWRRHHLQGVEMANLALERSEDPEVRQLAFDISSTQTNQAGRMQGWLSLWGLPPTGGEAMAWMAGDDGGHTGHTMTDGRPDARAWPPRTSWPSCASLSGTEFDVEFLRLMIRHHQGGLEMAEYAAEHAEEPAVARLARTIAETQTAETTTMTDMLTARGGTPLPAP